jgi:hypothetical protein
MLNVIRLALFIVVPTVITGGVEGKIVQAAAATHHSLLLNDQGQVCVAETTCVLVCE